MHFKKSLFFVFVIYFLFVLFRFTMKIRQTNFCILIIYLFCSVNANGCPKATDFQCQTTKRCIDSSFRCNQLFDCEDRSDEENCEFDAEQSKCHGFQFQCFDGKCIDLRNLCNGIRECSFGEDERHCSSSRNRTCQSGQFKCSNGRCIPNYWACDGRNDCSNDEENCLKNKGSCGSKEFTCLDRIKCIRLDQRCDLNADCVDGSDEMGCDHSTKKKMCQPNQFKCSDGKCIDMSNVCDGVDDCSVGEDEKETKCKKSARVLCHSNQFKCSNGQCIPKYWICDGTIDCSNDEVNCPAPIKVSSAQLIHNITCDPNDFMCLDKLKCINPNLKCDSVADCADGSDEQNCNDNDKISESCAANKFKCLDGKCIDLGRLCNGFNDCSFGEDELDINCNKTLNKTCQPDEFMCSNNECIPEAWLCDGTKDCPNDEENCDCSERENGANGCVDKTANLCAKFKCPSNASCRVLEKGPTCVCANGFNYNEKRHECEDINECLEYDICSQGCINTVGSYRCTCIPKFKLTNDRQTCRVTGKIGEILLFTTSTSLNCFTLKSNRQRKLARNLDQAIGVSYHGKRVYWTNIMAGAESIMTAGMDGTDIMTLFTLGLGKPMDISVDYITGNIYFTDSDLQHLAVCTNDGRFCRAIITENVHRPRGIAIYPQKGILFWTDWGVKPAVSTASMDGTLNRALITQNVYSPNGLTVDWPNDRLYWVDAKFQSIESCRLDGSDRRLTIEKASPHPYGIAVFQDKLFWSDEDSNSIHSCHKFTGQNVSTVIRDNITIYDIEVYHPAMQPAAENPCAEHPCSHLCLLNMNHTYTCACPKGMKLSFDKHKCRPTRKQKLVFMGAGHHLFRLDHQLFGRSAENAEQTFKFRIDKIAHNSVNGEVFVADNQRKAIFQVNVKNGVTKEIIVENIGSVSAMTFDELSNNLYWSDSERNMIEVYSMDTHHRAVVQNFMGEDTPIALAAIEPQY